MWNELHLVWNYVSRRKLRTALTTLAILFGVAVIFAINLLLPGMRALLEGSLNPAGMSDLRVQSITGSAFDPALVTTVAGIEGVQAVAGTLRREVTLPLAGGSTTQVELVGVDPAMQQEVTLILVRAGRFLQPGDTGMVVLPASLADSAGSGVGETFPLVTVNGLKDFSVAGIYADHGLSLTPAVYIALEDAQAAFGLPGQINAVEVRFAAGADRKAVTERIATALGPAYRTGNAPTVDIGFLSAIFDLFGALALFVGGFLIFNTFRTVVVERRREIGLLRSVGADQPQIMRLILMESELQGVIGTGLGLLAGYPFAILTAGIISKSVWSGTQIDLTVTPVGILLPLVLGIGVTLAAGFLPARSAASIPPLAALQPPSLEKGRLSLPAGITGAVLAAAGLALMLAGARTAALGSLVILVGAVLLTPLLVVPAARLFAPLVHWLFPDVGAVALSNITRQPGRTAVTVTTMMVGVAVLVATNAMVATERASLFHSYDVLLASDSSDFTIMPSTDNGATSSFDPIAGQLGASADLAERIGSLPGVEEVASVRAAVTQYQGTPFLLVGIDPYKFPQLYRYGFDQMGSGDPYAALAGGRTIFINGYVRDHLGVEPGDTLSLQTAQGSQAYRIAAVLDDFTSATGENYGVISQANLARDFGVSADGQLLVKLAPGASRPSVRQALATILKDYPQFQMVDTVAHQLAVRDSFNAGLAIFDALLVAVLLPALLGLLNTLAINILERTTEIGLLRAVGSDRGMVRRLILAESLVVNLLGALIGFGVGAALSGTFIGVLNEITPGNRTVFPFGTIGIYLLVFLGLSLLVSLIPARNAARLTIVEALKSE